MGQSQETGSQRGRILRGFLRLFVGTFLSRVLGFARELVTAWYFGAGRTMDAFVVAFTVPNLFRRVLGEHAAESAFLPTFKGHLAKGEKKDAWAVASSVLNIMVIVLIVLVGIGYLAAPMIVRLLAPYFEEDAQAQAVGMTQVMLPFMLFIGLAALVGSILLAAEKHTAYALAPIVFSVALICSIVFLPAELGATRLAIGVLVGGCGQLLIQIPPLLTRKARADLGTQYVPRIDLSHPGTRQVGALMGPIVLAAFVERIGTVVDRILASQFDGGASSLSYAFRLVQLQYAVMALAVGRAVLPVLSEQNAKNDFGQFSDGVRLGVRLNLFLLMPASVGLLLLRAPVVELLYQRGSFDAEDARMTALALACYALGIAGMGLTGTLSRSLHAMLNTRLPLIAAAVGLAINVVFNLILVRTELRHAGLALATSIAFVCHALLLLWLVVRKVRERGGSLGWPELVTDVGKICVCTAACGLAVHLSMGAAAAHFASRGIVDLCCRLAVPAAAGAVVYGVCALGVGIEEMGIVKRLLLRRGGKTR